MSVKYAAQKHTDNHYVLPRMKDMRCDVHAFLSHHLYELSEESMWNQAMQTAGFEGVTAVYLMPDCHGTGHAGFPVGAVVVTDDTIIQAGSGFDISCGISCVRVPGLFAQDVKGWDVRERFVRECQRRIAFGLGSNRADEMPKFTSKKLEEILRHGAGALGVSSDNCERQFIKVGDEFDSNRIERAQACALPQLGSVGSGNHFSELQVDEKDGSVWVMIHCGSRGYGFQTADYFFKRGAELRGIPYNQREQSWLRLDEPLGKEYWAHHNAAANYAIANRHVIVDSVNAALRKVFKVEGELFYEISHNLIQEETLWLPDGTTKKGFVHRKGATRAFPAGHPSLVKTRWETTGHPCVVPGSMYAGAAILFPSVNARAAGCSVNHGSGRQLARGEAKRKLKHKQEFIDDQMNSVVRRLGNTDIRGIVTNTKKTPLDECGHAYKDLDEVLAVLETEDIARVERRLYPVACLKGTD